MRPGQASLNSTKHIAETTAALATHPAAFPEVLVTSSRPGAGMPELRAAIVRLMHERRLMSRACRILIVLAAIMGAAGVILGRVGTGPSVRGWSASSMLRFSARYSAPWLAARRDPARVGIGPPSAS